MATLNTLVTQLIAKTENFIGPMQDASKAVDRVQKKMETQRATFGMSARQVEIYKLAQQGATREQIRNAMALDRQITAMEQWEAAVKAAQIPLKVVKDTTEQTNSALTQFGAGLGKRLFAANALVSVLIGSLNAASRAAADVSNTNGLMDSLGDVAMGIPIFGDLATIVARIGIELSGAGSEARNLATRLETVQQRLGLTGAEAVRLQGVGVVLKGLEAKVAALGNTAEVAALKAAGATAAAIQRAMELAAQIEAYNRATANDSGRAALIRSLEEQAGLWGTNAREIDLYKASLLNATQADIDHINWLHDKLDAMKALQESQARMNKLMDEGRRVWEQTRTPLEAYNLRLEELRKLLEGGAIDEETFQRAVDQAREALERQTKVEDKVEEKAKPPASVQFQSPAAIERRFGAGMPTGIAAAPELKTAKNTENLLVDSRRQTSIQNQQLTILKEIRDRQPEVFGGSN